MKELRARLADAMAFAHMPLRKSADGAVANLVRSGRKQPQRFRAGSSASTPFRLGIRTHPASVTQGAWSDERIRIPVFGVRTAHWSHAGRDRGQVRRRD